MMKNAMRGTRSAVIMRERIDRNVRRLVEEEGLSPGDAVQTILTAACLYGSEEQQDYVVMLSRATRKGQSLWPA